LRAGKANTLSRQHARRTDRPFGAQFVVCRVVVGAALNRYSARLVLSRSDGKGCTTIRQRVD